MVDHDEENRRLTVSGPWNLRHGREICAEIEVLSRTIPGATVTLDMRAVESIDSSGISDLIQLNSLLQTDGRKLVLFRPPEPVRSSLHLVRIDRVIPIIE